MTVPILQMSKCAWTRRSTKTNGVHRLQCVPMPFNQPCQSLLLLSLLMAAVEECQRSGRSEWTFFALYILSLDTRKKKNPGPSFSTRLPLIVSNAPYVAVHFHSPPSTGIGGKECLHEGPQVSKLRARFCFAWLQWLNFTSDGFYLSMPYIVQSNTQSFSNIALCTFKLGLIFDYYLFSLAGRSWLMHLF